MFRVLDNVEIDGIIDSEHEVIEMNNEWQKVEYVDQRGVGKMVVTIQSSGRMSFNVGAREAFLKDIGYIELFYNKEKNLLGMRPTNDKTVIGLFPVKDAKWGKYLPARFFLNKYGLKPERAMRYELTWDESQMMLVIDLNKPISSRQKSMQKAS